MAWAQHPQSGEVIELEDNYTPDGVNQTAKEAETKGWKLVEPLENPKTGERIHVERGAVKEAMSKGWIIPQLAQAQRNMPKGDGSLGEAVKDAWTSFDPTMGVRDEIWGGVGAVVNPDNVPGTMGERYRAYRDADRRAQAEAMERSPKASTVGRFAGDVAPTVLTLGAGAGPALARAGAAGVVGGSVGVGFGSGVARSEKESLPEILDEGAQAGWQSGLLPVAGVAVSKAAGATGRAVANSPLVQKARDVYRNVADAASKVDEAAAGKGKAQGIISGVKEVMRDVAFNKTMVRAFEQGTGQSTKGLSDAEIRAKIFEELAKPGQNTFKRWLIEETAKRSGKPSGALEDALTMGAARRNEVRAWDPDAQLAEARDVARKLQGVTDEVETGRAMERGRLERRAAEEYGQNRATGTLEDPRAGIQEYVDDLVEPPPAPRANARTPGRADDFATEFGSVADEAPEVTGRGEAPSLSIIPSKNQAEIKKAMAILDQGAGVRGMGQFGLQKGAWHEVDPAEQYSRLQQARELIDEQRKYFEANSLGKAEQLMRNLRGRFDEALKAQESKVASDRVWSESQRALDNFNGPISYRQPSGRTVIDPVKVKQSFQKTDAGHRMTDYVTDFENTAQEFNLGSPQTREEALGAWRAGAKKADDRAALTSFEKDGSPSGLAIERLQASNAKNIVQEFLASPANVLRKIDETVKLQGRTWTPDELNEVMKWRAQFEQLAKNPPQKPVSSSSGMGVALGTFLATTAGKALAQRLMTDQ